MAFGHRPGVSQGSGFTLIEAIVVILVIGVMAAVAIPVAGNMLAASKVNATLKEMAALKVAIIGRSGSASVRGYENDVGSAPPDLQGLVAKPPGVSSYDRFTQTGWNGPYIDGDNGDYLKDAWGVDYIYDPTGRTIKSVGGPDTLTVSF